MNLELRMNEHLKEAMILAAKLESKVGEFITMEEDAKTDMYDITELDELDDTIIRAMNIIGGFIGRSIMNNVLNDVAKEHRV